MVIEEFYSHASKRRRAGLKPSDLYLQLALNQHRFCPNNN